LILSGWPTIRDFKKSSSKIEVRLARHYQFGLFALGGTLSSAIEAFCFRNTALATERPS
jgi:hypothetical protein